MDASRKNLWGVFMEAIDLTQLLNNNTPVYPGTAGPVINEATTIENDGFAEKLISMYSHTGTHMDSPSHMIRGAKSLDEFDASKYTGDGIVIDVSKTGSKIEVDHIRSAIGARNKIEFILLKTKLG
ncbi:MAG: cyclase family protein [Candidatus Moduliflexus flocculans]|nr:cyclase family protein [Candidatus Moduliflexus flocculans]